MDMFSKLANKIKSRSKNIIERFKAYFRKLLFPLYLFPIKFVTYTLYYLIKFLIKLILAVLGLIIDCIKFPFKSLKNFLKALFFLIIALYLLLTFMVIAHFLATQYGGVYRYKCIFNDPRSKLINSVVRIEGSYGEGSGFFINENQILTNFHVIANEPSPKIILPNGSILTPVKILGDKNADIAVLYINEKYPDLILSFPDELNFYEDEPLFSGGYALGTDLTGEATVVKGNYTSYRISKNYSVDYIQTNLSLVTGMSGGPLINQCYNVVGMNTSGLAGLSLFISPSSIKYILPLLTDQNIAKIDVDPSKSPEDAVYAFYTYLKARRMQDGFNLLSQKYLEKTNFQEWTARFTNILDVTIYKSTKFENSKDTVFIKFSTKNWVDGEVEDHFYEGTWQTIKEDGVYKMLQSKIVEVNNPGWDWFYE